MGRFLSTDPVVKRRKNSRFSQRWNRYIYALNNPLKFFDSDGEDVELSPGMQNLVSGGSKQFRQAWNAFLNSDAGNKYFERLDQNHGTLVKLVAATDKQMVDEEGRSLGETKITGTDQESGEVTEQVISINFEVTGGTEELADTFLDEFIHADQNLETDGTSTEEEDHDLKEKENEETDLDGQVKEHIKK